MPMKNTSSRVPRNSATYAAGPRSSTCRSLRSIARRRKCREGDGGSLAPPMGLADTFDSIVSSLPGDWTDLEIDLRLADENRYIDAAVYLVTCNAQPYSQHD